MRRITIGRTRTLTLPLPMGAGVLVPFFLAVALSAQLTPDQASSLDPLTADVTILTRDGRVPDTVDPSAVSVTLDGVPRRVAWVRRLSRGPGARADAARRAATHAANAGFDAEASRTVVVAIDLAGLRPGDERATLDAASAFLDRLGLGDRVAVVTLPIGDAPSVTLSDEPPVVREALARVAGRRAGAVALPATGIVGALQELVTTLGGMPGRKFVALFSAGRPDVEAGALAALASVAAGARVTVATIAREQATKDTGAPARGDGLAQIASVTGGTSVRFTRALASRDLDRLAIDLSAAYVIGFERLAADRPGQQHALRIDMAQRDLVVRGPSRWVVNEAGEVAAGDEGHDMAPATVPADPEFAIERALRGSPGPGDSLPVAEPATGELATILDRLTDYVASYERVASALVAEEDYKQSSPDKRVRLRSDVLIVKPPRAIEWVSFRDVFEVDGAAVREREGRLEALFLAPSPGASAQLQAIKAESARYNIGSFERDINVPYLALKFVRADTLSRMRFVLDGQREAAGVTLTRVEFEEVARPTIIVNRAGENLPAKGWFHVDPITGAVVESGLTVVTPDYEARLVVQYQRDPALGMWVPAKMDETYQVRLKRSSATTTPLLQTVLRGTATYSKFRRFKVETDERVADRPR